MILYDPVRLGGWSCARKCWQAAGYMSESFDIKLSVAHDLTTFKGCISLLTQLLMPLDNRSGMIWRIVELTMHRCALETGSSM